ncbi:MAG: cytochrome b/b6 domain-containing protein [Dehalococcoidia bacterium]
MRNILKQNLAKQVVHWLLLVVIVLYILTGFGITSYRAVEFLTFGLLTKPLAFKIHDNLIIPFIVLIVLHIYQQVKKASEV